MSIRKHSAGHRHVASDIIGNVVPALMSAESGKTFLTQDKFGYIDVAGIHFGSNWGDIYRQTVVDDEEVTHYVMELSGEGLIVDGYINVNQISMNQGELSLGRYGGDGGYIYFTDGDDVAENDARIAQVTIAGQTLPVVAIQAYAPGNDGKYGYWGLGSLDVSNLFVDHLIASSGSYGISMFSPLRLCYSTDGETFTGVRLYDSTNDAGSEGDVLTIASDGKPVWGIGGANAWSAGAVSAIDTTAFSIVNKATNNIFIRGGLYRTHQTNTNTLSLNVTQPLNGNTYVLIVVGKGTNLNTDIMHVNSITQTGVTWTAQYYAYTDDFLGTIHVFTGRVNSESAGTTISINLTYTCPSVTVDCCEYSGIASTDYVTSVNAFRGNSGNAVLNGFTVANPNSLVISGVLAFGGAQTNGGAGTMRDGQYANGISLNFTEVVTTTTAGFSVGSTFSSDYWVHSWIVLKGIDQTSQQVLTFIGEGGSGSGSVSYSASSPITLTGNVFGFNAVNTNLSVLSLTASDDVTCDHVYLQGVTGANLTSWNDTIYNSNFTATQATTYGVQSSGDFYIPNSMKLAGLLQFSYSSKACGLIWSNDYTLSLIADSGSPFSYYTTKNPRTGETVAQYLAYFGALNVGAVFTQYINPIGTGTGTTFGGNLILGYHKKLTDAAGTQSAAALAGQVLLIDANGYPVWGTVGTGSGSYPSEIYCNHLYFNGDTSAYFTNTASSGGSITTSAGFNVNGDATLAGKIQFNSGATAAYLIWSNSYVLTLGANGGVFHQGTSPHGYTGYFGALDCGAVFTKYVNPIDGSAGVTIGGKLVLGEDEVLVDGAGTASSSSIADYVLTVNASGVPVWAPPPSGSGSTNPFNQTLNTTSNVQFNNLTLTGTLGTTGSALTLTPDVNFAHTNVVNVNVNSTNSSDVAFSLQCGGSTKGAFGYDASDSKTYLIAYTDSTLAYSQMHILGSKIVLENDVDCLALLNVNGACPTINLLAEGSTKGAFGYNGTKTYLVAYTDSTLAQSQLHLLGSKIVIENDTDFIGRYVNISGSNPVINLQHNGSNRVDLGFDGTNNYFRARNAGNLDIINESGSIAVTSSTGVMYTVGGLQIRPNTGNTGQIGSSTEYYFATYANYVYGKNPGTFDEYDDLSILSQWGEKTPTLPDNYDQSKIKPPKHDPFAMLRGKDKDGKYHTHDFFDVNSLTSFALGCAKALSKKHDETINAMLIIQDNVDAHNSKIMELENKVADLLKQLSKLKAA